MAKLIIGLACGFFRYYSETDDTPRILLPDVQPLSLSIDPGKAERIYCATYNRGLWRSEDAGFTWFPIGAPQNFYGAYTPGSIAASATTSVSVSPEPEVNGRHAVWVGTELSSVYRSTDNGETFELVSELDMSSRGGVVSAPA